MHIKVVFTCVLAVKRTHRDDGLVHGRVLRASSGPANVLDTGDKRGE